MFIFVCELSCSGFLKTYGNLLFNSEKIGHISCECYSFLMDFYMLMLKD